MSVNVHPLAPWMRATRFRPGAPPVFPNGEPSRDEVELALALFSALDSESQTWRGGQAFIDRLRARLASSHTL